jgi:hypothetical protein
VRKASPGIEVDRFVERSLAAFQAADHDFQFFQRILEAERGDIGCACHRRQQWPGAACRSSPLT